MTAYQRLRNFAGSVGHVAAQKWPDKPIGEELVWGAALMQAMLVDHEVLAPAEINTAVVGTHFAARWNQSGYPTFALTHGLCAKLLLTDPTGITVDEIRWPFQSFVIQLPGPDPYITYDSGTGPVTATAILFHRMKKPSENLRSALLEAMIPLCDETGIHIQTVADNTSITIHLLLEDPTTPAILAEAIAAATIGDESENVAPGLSLESMDLAANKAAVRLCLNLMLYINSLSAQEKWPCPPTNAKDTVSRGTHPVKRWELGREIKLPSAMRALARSAEEHTPAWRLKARFLVRGHWRNQAYGPAHSLRRRQWLEPYVKGPDDGERLDRVYTVD